MSNGEPRHNLLNDLNTLAFSSFTNQCLWLATGFVVLALLVWAVMTDHVERLDHAMGYLGLWLGFVTGKSAITAGRDIVKRTTDVDYQAAKATRATAKASTTTVSDRYGTTTILAPGIVEHVPAADEGPTWAGEDPHRGIL